MNHQLKVLFVSSGNKTGHAVPVILNQAESLISEGVNLDFYLVQGKGYWGYLKNLLSLKSKIRDFKPDIIHAHGLASLLTVFLPRNKVIISLLGSELNENPIILYFIKFLSKFYWKGIIVKSKDMYEKLGIKNNSKISIIPNGVDLQRMRIMKKNEAREKLNWNINDKTILFLADPNRKSKNYKLAKDAISLINDECVNLQLVYNIPKNDVFWYLNATDVLLSTSLWEGSPNVIKEAMACNCPVVSTDVGDVKWLLGDIDGHYVVDFDAQEIANKINQAVDFSIKNRRTKGRQRLIDLGLDNRDVAIKIKDLYHKLIISKT